MHARQNALLLVKWGALQVPAEPPAPKTVDRHVQILTAQEAVQIRAPLLVGLLVQRIVPMTAIAVAALPVEIMHVG